MARGAAGRSLIWEVTVSCTTADSYLEASSREAGAAAKLAASNKVVKYAGLSSQGEFVPIAVESHDPINRDALQFLSELGRRLVETTGMSIFVFIPTDFRCGAKFLFGFAARWFYWWLPASLGFTTKQIS